jgi:PEGA domain
MRTSFFLGCAQGMLALSVLAATAAPCWAAKPIKAPQAATKTSAGAPASAPTPAPAPGPKSLADSLTGEAKAAYDAGRLLYGDGDFAGAIVKLQAAYDLAQDPRLLWNMAACEKGMRHYAKVVTLVRKYLAAGGDVIGEDDRKQAEELLAAIESFTVGLAISVNEPDAQVTIDGEPVGTTPLPGPVTVDIGARQIEVKKPGFLPFSQSVPVGGSKDAALAVKLVPEVHQGELTVNAPPTATILIDGKRVGVGHFVATLGSGGHTLRVEAPAMRPYQSEVMIQDREKRGVDVVLEASAAPSAPHESAGPLHDMELGLRMGLGSMTTKASPLNGTGDRTQTVSFIPIGVDIGYRLGRPTYLGIYGQYGWLDKSNTCGIARHGPNSEYAGDPATRYGYTSCHMAKVGVALVFHILPKTIVDPYFGFDFGIQGTFTRYRSFDPTTGVVGSGNDNNAALQPGFQLGVDSHPIPALSAGLFFQGGPDIGSEGKPQDNGSNSGSNNNCQSGSGSSCGSQCSSGQSCNQDSGTRVSGHVLLGVRVAYTFP